MKWLLKRLLIICLIMGVLCAAAIVVGRLDHSPSKLQAFGIENCDGQACFRGIKIGTDWATIQKMFPTGRLMANGFDDKVDSTTDIAIGPSQDNRTVDGVTIYSDRPDTNSLPFTAADIIASFGAPCRIFVGWDKSDDGFVGIIYPMITINLATRAENANGTVNYQLDLNSAVDIFSVTTQSSYGTCNDSLSLSLGPWHGFKSQEQYRDYNLRDLNIAKTTP